MIGTDDLMTLQGRGTLVILAYQKRPPQPYAGITSLPFCGVLSPEVRCKPPLSQEIVCSACGEGAVT